MKGLHRAIQQPIQYKAVICYNGVHKCAACLMGIRRDCFIASHPGFLWKNPWGGFFGYCYLGLWSGLGVERRGFEPGFGEGNWTHSKVNKKHDICHSNNSSKCDILMELYSKGG
ncbi:hypothetical protein ACVNS2_21940 [Paenibacillus caseinilyticus]|nr:hypothetical protein [Paenibacillus mucilaginosus]WFA19594.1 hypothetical protein ERY13_21270 [Paenibacillus mucilaginosus]